MRRSYAWLAALLAVMLIVAACGPQLATPTPRGEVAEAPSGNETTAPSGETATAVTPPTVAVPPTTEPLDPAGLPVDADDWRALGSPDAPVTVIEYTDFQ
jgi:hypothetical protein